MFLACIVAGFILAHFWPLPIIRDAVAARVALSIALFLLAVVVIGRGRRELVRHREHPNPYKPTGTIVVSGIYSRTRNPLYLGFLLVAIAIAVAADDAWLLLSVVVLFLLLHFGAVKPEERYLSAKFGETYEEYRRTVRRWV